MHIYLTRNVYTYIVPISYLLQSTNESLPRPLAPALTLRYNSSDIQPFAQLPRIGEKVLLLSVVSSLEERKRFYVDEATLWQDYQHSYSVRRSDDTTGQLT